MTRRQLLAVAVGSLIPIGLLFAGCGEVARAGSRAASHGGVGKIPMGMYESVEMMDYAHQSNVKRIGDMATRGFTLVLNYNTMDGGNGASSKQDVLDYANLAQSKGMKVIWELRNGKDTVIWGSGTTLVNKYSNFARDVGATTDEQLMSSFVDAVKDHPATYGYYMADEPLEDYYFELVKHNAGVVKRVDPNHPIMVLYGWWMATDDWLNKLLSPNIDMYGIDYYPWDPPKTVTPGEAKMPVIVNSVYQWTVHNNKKFFIVPQAYGFESYTCSPTPNSWPTEEQMRRWRDIILANSQPEFMVWYSYFDAVKGDCNWSRPANFMDQVQAAVFN